MGENKLIKGMLIGALAGVVYALFDKDTRLEASTCVKRTSGKIREYAAHPSDAIHDFRLKYEHMAQAVTAGSEQAVHILDQLNEFLEKIESQSEEPPE
ncbi:hypothetical protein N780_17235 [Pontibacillus chungwhensis BH030062]|uniref:YtxH domain-containing protein n=1 Tax=Pontibacillus chungwhensis BH030062 TaxID=1385513 RepID=A0A0A2URV2_9BACI|nr:YtxH domain-containing protein [Pontibacillus chungwhensis]KGP91017.1 hypothetical protein N780_17235 [Pontibacillus chungwhensis BH030062]